ncbi:MAG: hypothetical protein J07HQX50_02229 [Haloquadratum sp. J07HQX50]|jgi:hypothetical protein|nr:MAG: hypothetical protein J07HQX50_02229 [Haloquadratum sp. J07HQX50]
MHADHPRKPAVEDILIKQTNRVDLGIITFIWALRTTYLLAYSVKQAQNPRLNSLDRTVSLVSHPLVTVLIYRKLAVGLVFAMARAETSESTASTVVKQTGTRNALCGASSGFVMEPLADYPANLQFPTLRIDLLGQH